MSEIKTKIRTYNDVIDLFGEEKAADMLSEALDWSTIDPKNDKKNIMERKPLLLDPYMTYEGEDYCKHIVAGFLCVPDLDDFDQMKEFFLDCAAEYFRYLSSDDMEKMLAALGKRVDVLATPTDDVFISVSPDAVLRQYPDITIDEAIQIRDNACENIWESGGQSDLDEIVWDQIGAEYKSIKSDSHRGLSDVKDAKAKQAVHVNDDRENDAVALNVQEK